MNLYEYKVQTNTGETIDLNTLKDNVILIVNVASGCGLTPQYEGLEKLYKKYKDSGLTVIGFPCNQFLQQEPGSDEEIHSFCKTTYDVTFPVSVKIEVNGDNADPIYKFIKKAAPFTGFADKKEEELFTPILTQNAPSFLNDDEITWNFTKFIVEKNGGKITRFQPTVGIDVLEEKIKELL